MSMRELEIPLVIFTVLSQTAVGMALFAALRGTQSASDLTTTQSGLKSIFKHEWGFIFLFLYCGIFAASFHLGKPLGVIRILNNVAVSWFSREILFVGIFGGLVALSLLLRLNMWPAFLPTLNRKLVERITACAGLFAILVMGITYAWTGMDPIHNIVPLLFFVLTTFVLGAAFISYFVEGEALVKTCLALKTAVITSLVVNFSVPFIWLSGGTLMWTSGNNYLAAPTNWFHLVILGLTLLIVRNNRIPKWLPPLLMIAELSGRLGIFMLVEPSHANIGNLY